MRLPATDKFNDEFMHHYEDVHRCKMKLMEVIRYPAGQLHLSFKQPLFSFIKKTRMENKQKKREYYFKMIAAWRCVGGNPNRGAIQIAASLNHKIVTIFSKDIDLSAEIPL